MAVLQAKITRVSTSRVLLTLLIVLQYYCAKLSLVANVAKRSEKREKKLNVLAKLVVIFGHELSKTTFYMLTSVVAVGIAFLLLGTQGISKKRGNRPDVEGTLDVVVVGCGLPKKGMGWFHLTQLLEMETCQCDCRSRALLYEPRSLSNPT
jgi:hypothetical protein